MRIHVDTTIPTKNPNKPIVLPDENWSREDGGLVTVPGVGKRWRPGWRESVERWFKQMNWKLYHTKRSQGSQEGFPDLVLLHPVSGVLLYAELKTESGKVSNDQEDWMIQLAHCGQIVYLWRPSDQDEIMTVIENVHNIGRGLTKQEVFD